MPTPHVANPVASLVPAATSSIAGKLRYVKHLHVMQSRNGVWMSGRVAGISPAVRQFFALRPHLRLHRYLTCPTSLGTIVAFAMD